VLVWFAASAAELEAARGVAEVLVVEEPLLPAALETGVPVFVIVHARSTEGALAVRVAALDPRAHVLLVPDAAGSLVDVAHLVADLSTDHHGGAASPGRAGTLRDRLGLPAPDPLLVDARSAFPAPVAQAAL
jgi:hypothetical protein